jgi:phage terminase large subunit GpA-like protein
MPRFRKPAASPLPPLEGLAAWITRSVRLPLGSAAKPGQFRFYSYQRGLADAIGDPSLERVSILKSARVGFTSVLTASIAWFVCRDPSPILVLLPTEADCRDFMVSDIEPMFADSPAIASKLPMPKPGKSIDRNKLLHRIFHGGSLKIVAGKAPRNLRRHTARILLIDEADAVEASAEGDPISLAEKRTLSFDNRKIVVGSTPLAEDTSHICRLYAQSDQRIFEVPCPHCDERAEIRWSAIEWPEGKPERAVWRCPHCGAAVTEDFKQGMVAKGQWRITRPDVRGHAGFRISALVSPLANASWAKLAAEYEVAKNDTSTLKVFINTVLGEPWRDEADEIDETALATRVESFDLNRIPADVLAITCGCDVQDDRIELSTVGHGRDNAIFVLAHEVVWGSPLENDTWHEIDKLLRRQWRSPRGGPLKVDAAVIDAGDGGHFDNVLAFCNPRMSRRILAGKGVYGFARPTLYPSKNKKGRFFIIGVDIIKTQIINRLSRGRTIRFSNKLEKTYFEQLASERRIVRMSRGRPVVRFERKMAARAEALDCLVYALAAKAGLSLNFDEREDTLNSPVPPKAEPTVIRSKWMAE